jgi:Ca-activated chloride channel family protein
MHARRTAVWAFVSVLAIGGFVTGASAQGLLIADADGVRLPRPVPPVSEAPTATYKLKELDVQVKLVDQVAQVQLAQTVVNTGSQPLAVSFVFPLPYDGAVDRLTLMVDGKEIPGKLLSAEEARKLYEEAVRKSQDPALLEWLGSGMFKTSVFPIPPGAERKVTLGYSQLCKQERGLTDFLYPLSTAKYTSQPIEKMNLRVVLESSTPIKNIYSPTHTVDIQKSDDKHATIAYSATEVVPSNDFRLFYDVDAGQIGARLLSYRPAGEEEGYFLMLAAPQLPTKDEKVPKTVMLVVDRSGSMTGEKIEQARGALRFVLQNLHEGDLFNIVAYDSRIETFKPELQVVNHETRAAALGFAEGLFAGGSTNIDGALTVALAQLADSSRPNYVLFLTDGLPTEGEQNESKIVAHSEQTNKVRARILSFGVGYDVNSRLLDRLSSENYGQSQYVRPNENIESHVSRLYQRIESPVLTDVAIKFGFDGLQPADGEPVSRVYPREAHDMFGGEQLVVVGRYKKHGAAKLTITGNVAGGAQTYEFPVEFIERSGDQSYGFVEKLWATRRIGEIIDELDLKGRNEELLKELVALSTRHGILTPYTSFLADEQVQLNEVAANARVAGRYAESLERADGVQGFAQRANKAALRSSLQAPAEGLAVVKDLDDRNVVMSTVCNVGNKSFFRRGVRWVESTISDEEIAQAKKIVQFSDEYFALANQADAEARAYLAFDEPSVVKIAGTCYQIEPPVK